MRSIQKIRKIHKPAFLLYKSKRPKKTDAVSARKAGTIFLSGRNMKTLSRSLITVSSNPFFLNADI